MSEAVTEVQATPTLPTASNETENQARSPHKQSVLNGESMKFPLPWFFRDFDSEEALIEQIDWLKNNMGVSNEFFASVLGIRRERFCRWRGHKGPLSESEKNSLRELWSTMHRLLLLTNFEVDRMKQMFESTPEGPDDGLPCEEPDNRLPWGSISIKQYFQNAGIEGVSETNRWLQSLKSASSR